MGFLEQIFGAELGLPARFVLAFVLILALIGLAVWVFRYFGMSTMARVGTARGRQPRLSVLEATPVDARRRLVLIRRDNVEHLMLVGGPTDVVVESNIVNATPLMTAPVAAAAAEPMPRTIGRPARLAAERETETPLVPAATPQLIAPSSEGITPAQPRPEFKSEPKGASRAESQYADMAHRLEAALRRPIEHPGAPRPAPTAPAHPSAAGPRVEPKIEAAPEPTTEPKTEPPIPPRMEPRPAPTPPSAAPAPRAPEPAPMRPAAAPTPPAVTPQPAPQAAPKRDVFANLEEEMANLLGRGGKSN